MFLRFVCDLPVDGSDARAGFFCAAYALRDDGDLDPYTRDRLEDLLGWFRTNLTIPERFSRSVTGLREKETTRGLSWFRADAAESLEKSWELKGLLEGWGYQIEVLRTLRPGYVIYEDDDQIVADPFADTPR